MSCKITFKLDNITETEAEEMAEEFGYDPSWMDFHDGQVTITDPEEDSLDALEDHLMINEIDFVRVTAEPSQMGQEPHMVTHRAGMERPEVTFL